MVFNLEDDEKLPQDDPSLRFATEIDDRLKRLKTGIDAQAQWSDVVSRIADALEHFSIAQSFAALAMQGYETAGVGLVGHRADCPNCLLVRSAVKAPSGRMVLNPFDPKQ
jgi:hypothetical protein